LAGMKVPMQYQAGLKIAGEKVFGVVWKRHWRQLSFHNA
jgi:hypothetical protein